MDWPSRMRIALGSAKGLAYLHEDCKKLASPVPPFLLLFSLSYSFVKTHAGHPKIIHRDIKTANILLDYNFEAMVFVHNMFSTLHMNIYC